MKAVKVLAFLFLLTFLAFPILQCRAQTTNPKITQDQYQWTDDMKRLKITTPDKGLIFKITILNEGNSPLEIDKLYINVRVESSNRQFWSFFEQLSIDHLYLPPKEADYRFVKVDFGSYESIIGSYTAELTYFIGYVSGNGNPIEVYPFDFRVLGDEAFQQEIQQNRGGIIINIGPFNFTLIDLGGIGGGITVFALGGLYLWHRSKKKKKRKASEISTENATPP
jgi:hypothetical protein